MQQLRKLGVDTRPFFYPMSEMPYFTAADTPVAHAISVRGLNLPTYIDLTVDDVRSISQIMGEELGKA